MAEFLSSDPAVQDAHPHTVYDLIANICHDGQAGSGKGTYRVHIRQKVRILIMNNIIKNNKNYLEKKACRDIKTRNKIGMRAK